MRLFLIIVSFALVIMLNSFIIVSIIDYVYKRRNKNENAENDFNNDFKL